MPASQATQNYVKEVGALSTFTTAQLIAAAQTWSTAIHDAGEQAALFSRLEQQIELGEADTQLVGLAQQAAQKINAVIRSASDIIMQIRYVVQASQELDALNRKVKDRAAEL